MAKLQNMAMLFADDVVVALLVLPGREAGQRNRIDKNWCFLCSSSYCSAFHSSVVKVRQCEARGSAHNERFICFPELVVRSCSIAYAVGFVKHFLAFFSHSPKSRV